METVAVEIPGRACSYSIEIGRHSWSSIGERLKSLQLGPFVLFVTDDRVGPIFGKEVERSIRAAGFDVEQVRIPHGESNKNLRTVLPLYDVLERRRADRQSIVLAVGGGVVSDLAGFVAATWNRGVAFVPSPTTLLSMVDASVGGKVGVDHGGAKNCVGAFHQPKLVWCNLAALDSLPDREFRCGLAECIKHGFVLDPSYLKWIEANVDQILRRDASALQTLVSGSCRLKKQVVEEDPEERGGRRWLLNFGHTFAHAFETAGGFSEPPHGEAVSMGMVCAATLAEKLSLVDRGYVDRLRSTLNRVGLPTSVPPALLKSDLLAIMKSDKKAKDGAVRFVLPTKVGDAALKPLTDDALVRDVIASCSGP